MAKSNQETKVNFDVEVSIKDCAKMIARVGHKNTVLIKGEPGTGKTSIQKMLRDAMGTDKWIYVYVDCPNVDMGDICMNIPDRDTHQLEQYVGAMFKIPEALKAGKKLCVMLDEFGKSDKMMKKILTRVIQERSVGDVALPEGSIVWATTNHTADGVGDILQAHEGNRLTIISMRKPTHKEWGIWASDNNISSLTRAWVAMNPACMNSYTQLSNNELAGNAFIFNPRTSGPTFFSPRSAEKNDMYVKDRVLLGEDATAAAMTGTVGKAAAESMSAFFLIEKDLIPVKKIIAHPKTVLIPESTGALLMILFNAVDEIETQDELSAFMEWVLRIENVELQSVFYTMACASKKTLKLAKSNKYLSEWMVRNFFLFT